MGEWFTSFDDAWSSFLARTEPLGVFFDEFPDDPSSVAEGWLIVPPPEIKHEAMRLQAELAGIPGIVAVPEHFFHVWLRGEHGPDLEQLLELGPFSLSLARLNCFHTAVVAEVDSPGLERLDAPDTFLPHLSLAYVGGPSRPSRSARRSPPSESSRSGPHRGRVGAGATARGQDDGPPAAGPSSSALHCGDKVPVVPKLVDTTIRLLGQDPLAGTMGTAELLRLAEILDRSGVRVPRGLRRRCLRQRGPARRGEPWERIRAIQARVKTPLGLALRGRFLVGSRPVDGEFARRFVASAAENGIDVFRLHDPLNDVSNLREAAEAIAAAEREFEAGLVYSPGVAGEVDTLVEQARKLPELGAARVVVHDPTGSLGPHGAAELVQRIGEASGLPVGVYCQGAGRQRDAAALEAMRVGADLPRCASTRRSGRAPRLRRVARGGAQGPRPRHRRRRRSPLGGVGDRRPAHRRRAGHAARAASRRPCRRVPLPAGLVAGIDASLRAQAAGDRLDEVLEELSRIRGEVGSPPLAAPIGQILGSQALIHVLSAQRYLTVVDELRELVSGAYGTPPGAVDPGVRRRWSWSSVTTWLRTSRSTLEDVREQTQGLASSEEELLLVALFGDDAEALLQGIRARAGGDDAAARGVDRSRAERIREIVRVVQESGVGEVTIEEAGMRVPVRRTPDARVRAGSGRHDRSGVAARAAAASAPRERASCASRRRWSAPSTARPQPGAPAFVEEGDAVSPGQTLCILEAMKLMNEIKAETEGIVRKIHVENAQPVEFGQLLFELEPLGRPLGRLTRCSSGSWSRTAARSRCA